MPIVPVIQTSFGIGELGPYMVGRADLDVYEKSGKTIENFMVLPHGSLQRIPGFELVYDLSISDADSQKVQIHSFKRDADNQFVFVFTDLEVYIFRDRAYKATLTTPYDIDDVRGLRVTTRGDTMIITHEDYAPRKIEWTDDTTWAISTITFDNLPYFRYNVDQTLTPSGTSGSINLTVSGSDDYWTSDFVGTTVKLNGGDATITSITSGLIAVATVNATLSGTGADNAWTEEAWSTAHGFPRTVIFWQDRMIFGGTTDAPQLLMMSRSGDYFNFDDTSTDATYAIKAEINSDENHTIRDLKAQVNLLVMTDGGAFEVSYTDTSLTPTSVKIAQQSNVGISNLGSVLVDGELFYNTVDRNQMRSFIYSWAKNRYDADNKNVLSHHLYKVGQFPVSAAELRNFADSQANLLVTVREDGQLSILTIDSTKQAQGWWRRTTDGYFRAVGVAASADGNGNNLDTLYAVVQRDNSVYVEALTDQEIYLDHWYDGSSGTAKTNWTGLSTLEGQDVTVVGDGFVNGTYTVSSGAIELDVAVEDIYAGLPYTSTFETHDMKVFNSREVILGRRITKKRVIVDLYNSKSLVIDGYKVTEFRPKPGPLLDAPLAAFTGQIQKQIKGNPKKSQTVVFTVTDPLPCTINSLTTEVMVSD